jgi:ribonuclease BN (tRNA processing enzyme)
MASEVMLMFLGSGTILSAPDRSCSSVYLKNEKEQILVDIGCGTLRRLAEERIEHHRITKVFLTHFHPDHIGDLIPFLFFLRNSPHSEEREKLSIWGPEGFLAFIEGMEASFGSWINEPSDYLEFNELQQGSIDLHDFRLTWENVSHTPESVGYCFQFDNKVVSVSGDSGYCQGLIDLCRGADVAILECAHADEFAVEGHLTPALAAKIAESAKAKKVILTHFYPDALESNILDVMTKYYSGDVTLARDGMQLSLTSM